MKILTFTGRTPSEALKKAKMDANYSQMLHIDTKEIQKKSLGREPIYEIVMGIEGDSTSHSTYQKTKSAPKDERPLTQKSADVLYDISY
ncbi:MAG: flagellar biosynthesis protein FlhF, partial [Sulfurimonas sp.]